VPPRARNMKMMFGSDVAATPTVEPRVSRATLTRLASFSSKYYAVEVTSLYIWAALDSCDIISRRYSRRPLA
jgi:hypothetical protein